MSSGTGLSGQLRFLDFIHASKLFRAHLVLLVVFCGTRLLANCESSSSFANLKRFTAEVGLVRLVKRLGVATMGGVAGRGKVESAAAPGQSVHSHIPRQLGLYVQAIFHSNFSG